MRRAKTVIQKWDPFPNAPAKPPKGAKVTTEDGARAMSRAFEAIERRRAARES